MKDSIELTKKIIYFLLIASVLTSCKESKKETFKERTELIPEPDKDIRLKQEAEIQAKIENDFKFLDAIQTKNLPLKDSTNFDTYPKINKLTVAQIKLLSLDKVIENKDVTNIFLNYKVSLSSNFKTIVISYENGDSELMTTLINYNSKYEIIDFKQIAYDEIAESMLRTESEISKNSIVVSDINYADEQTDVAKTNYTITDDGKIISPKR